MSERDLLEALTTPGDNDPWKIAAGFVLGELRADARDIEVRVGGLERFAWFARGAIALLAAAAVPMLIFILEHSL